MESFSIFRIDSSVNKKRKRKSDSEIKWLGPFLIETYQFKSNGTTGKKSKNRMLFSA